MTDGTYAVQAFEHIEAIPGKALLRVAVSPSFNASQSTLIIDGSERIPPLPAPAGPPGVARIAFSIPADLAEGSRRYVLEIPDAAPLELGQPTRRHATRVTLTGSGAPAPVPAEPVSAANEELIAELERRLEAERARRVSADTAAETSAAARSASEARLTSLGAELTDTRADLESARGDLESTRSDLAATQERLRAAQGEAELGQTRANHARAEAEAAEAALIQRQAEIELLRRTLTDRDDHAQQTYLQWEQITAELSAEIEVARQVAANFQQHARSLQLELSDSKLELTSLRALREAHEQAVAAGSAVEGDSGDPAVVAAKLNAAAVALEQARTRASEAEHALAQREGELHRLRGQLPSA